MQNDAEQPSREKRSVPARPKSPAADGDEEERREESLTWRQRAQRLESDGLMHLERGEYARARQLLTKALGLYERHGHDEATLSVAQYLGVALHELGRQDQAVAVWEEMIRRGWSGPTIFGLLLQHYEEQGRPDKIERLHAQLRETIVTHGPEEFVPVPSPEPEEQESSGEGPRVLLADNDEEVRRVLIRMLRMDGYRVDAVSDGEAALWEILRHPPDVAILDVYMPRRSGLDVLYQLRARGFTTQAIVISGIADDCLVRDAVVLGARFLAKPLELDELRGTLEAILGRRLPARTQDDGGSRSRRVTVRLVDRRGAIPENSCV